MSEETDVVSEFAGFYLRKVVHNMDEFVPPIMRTTWMVYIRDSNGHFSLGKYYQAKSMAIKVGREYAEGRRARGVAL